MHRYQYKQEKNNFKEEINKESIDANTMSTDYFTKDRLTKRETKLNESFPRILPQWVKNDKKVLKFKGYFVEHIVESAYENIRVKSLNIFYYLDDDTIHIDEVRTENSGIVQGYFIKRQKIPVSKDSLDYISFKDFNLSKNIEFYGKVVRICDCDDFTKKHLANYGIELNQPEEIPEINQKDKFKNVDIAKNNKSIADLKEYIEVKLGGGHPNKSLNQFLENDRRVLSFDILWFDEKYDKEEKHYKMNYYLADGKVLP